MTNYVCLIFELKNKNSDDGVASLKSIVVNKSRFSQNFVNNKQLRMKY